MTSVGFGFNVSSVKSIVSLSGFSYPHAPHLNLRFKGSGNRTFSQKGQKSIAITLSTLITASVDIGHIPDCLSNLFL